MRSPLEKDQDASTLNSLDDRARLLVRVKSRDDTRLDDVVSSLTWSSEVLGLRLEAEGIASATMPSISSSLKRKETNSPPCKQSSLPSPAKHTERPDLSSSSPFQRQRRDLFLLEERGSPNRAQCEPATNEREFP